jgi:hypothetical protein
VHEQVAQERSADLAREGAAAFPIHILGTNLDGRSGAKRLRHFYDRRERRQDDNLDIRYVADFKQQRLDKSCRSRLHHVHLPIGSDDLLTHKSLR